jgi:hypothetical protein
MRESELLQECQRWVHHARARGIRPTSEFLDGLDEVVAVAGPLRKQVEQQIAQVALAERASAAMVAASRQAVFENVTVTELADAEAASPVTRPTGASVVAGGAGYWVGVPPSGGAPPGPPGSADDSW